MTLAQIVHRIVKDSAFAARLQQEPQLALAATRLKLDKKELAALTTVLHDKTLCNKLCSSPMDGPHPLQGWV